MTGRKRVTKKPDKSNKRSYASAEDRRRKRFLMIVVWVVVFAMVGGLGLATVFTLLLGGDDEALPETTTSTRPLAELCPRPETPPTPRDVPARDPVTIEIDLAVAYHVTMATSCGTMEFDLLPGSSPTDVSNFVALSKEGFYNGLTFHRIIEDFMIQGGDPIGADPLRAGGGDPGYSYTGEVPPAPTNAPVYKIGDLAMANSGDSSSNGSQFFIVSGPAGVRLPALYSLFGSMTAGVDVLERIQVTPTNAKGFPEIPVVINSITIAES